MGTRLTRWVATSSRRAPVDRATESTPIGVSIMPGAMALMRRQAAGHRVYRRLGGGVGDGSTAREQSCHRGDVDDGSVSSCPQVRQHIFAGHPHAGEVDFEGAAPVRRGEVLGAPARHDPDVVVEHVDVPEDAQGGLRDRGAVLLGGDVGAVGNCFASTVADQCGGLLGRFLVPVDDQDVGAFSGVGQRHGAAIAQGGPRSWVRSAPNRIRPTSIDRFPSIDQSRGPATRRRPPPARSGRGPTRRGRR